MTRASFPSKGAASDFVYGWLEGVMAKHRRKDRIRFEGGMAAMPTIHSIWSGGLPYAVAVTHTRLEDSGPFIVTVIEFDP